MQPIPTPDTNITFTAEDPEVGALPAQVIEGQVISVWDLTEIEREQLTEGANLTLSVFAMRPPPTGLSVSAPYCELCSEPMSWSENLRTFTCDNHVGDGHDDPSDK